MSKPSKSPLRCLLADHEAMVEIEQKKDEILEAARGGSEDEETLDVARGSTDEGQLDLLVHRDEGAVSEGEYTRAEAVVLLTGRPSLLIQDGMWQPPPLNVVKKRLSTSENELKAAISKVGRVELAGRNSSYFGTGWMLEKDVLITNRHVAAHFARREGGVLSIARDADGDLYEPQVDFRREYDRSTVARRKIKDVVYLEENSALRPDFSLLLLDGDEGALMPIELDEHDAEFDADIAVVGYPAEDPRNDAFVTEGIFKSIYRVKRLSPGKVRGVALDGKVLLHDCTTLGGNSGSVLLNLATGKACGLHFSGDYRVNNYAVSAGWLKSRLLEIGRHSKHFPAPAAPPAGSAAETAALADATARVAAMVNTEAPAAPDLAGRRGYQPGFLGADELEVPLPVIPEELQPHIAPVQDDDAGELRYTHFSVVMRADRRLAFFTACNIAGDLLFNFPRAADRWYADPRLQNAGDQTDQSLYASNPLDRGHLVRRLDPAWGETRAEAKQAELDTFFFTNCTPQHSRLNQRVWLRLEDYVLRNAAVHDLKVTVFTGPVMRPTDRGYRGTKLPEEFWKVVAVKHAFTGKLSATGYLLSQAADLQDLEFVYGEFKTYQISLRTLEARTGLSFGDLPRYDPLARLESASLRRLDGEADLVL